MVSDNIISIRFYPLAKEKDRRWSRTTLLASKSILISLLLPQSPEPIVHKPGYKLSNIKSPWLNATTCCNFPNLLENPGESRQTHTEDLVRIL